MATASCDTLPQRDMEIGAFVTAATDFALFFWRYDRMVLEETRLVSAVA